MMKSAQKKNILTVICLVLLCSLFLCGYGSYTEGAQRVFDDADLLDELEEQTVQAEIDKTVKKMSMDIVVVTIDDAMGKSTMAYADDYYDEHGFGYGDSYGPGILFLIDMDNREFYISIAGGAINEYSDWEIEQMLDEIEYWMLEGDWHDACMVFVDEAAEYGSNEEKVLNGYYDEKTDTFVEYTEEEVLAMRRRAAIKQVLSAGSILGKLVLSMIIGGVGVLILRLFANSNSAPAGKTYLKSGSEKVRQQYDHKTNTTVTRRQIPRNNDSSGTRSGGGGGRSHSTVHRSSSGRSHSGGGRKF